MTVPAPWQNPINVPPGQIQANVDASLLCPSRKDLSKVRLDAQQVLRDAGVERNTPIEVTPDGVIWDGHHAVRIAAEKGIAVTVKVVNVRVNATASSILDLPVG